MQEKLLPPSPAPSSASPVPALSLRERFLLASLPWRAGIAATILILALIGASDLYNRAVASNNFSSGSSGDASNAADGTLAVGPAFAAGSAQAPLIPVRLKIPSIGVDAPVEHTGLTAAGALQAPSDMVHAAWYANGVRPGASGNAVIDGHVNNALTTLGVFSRLDQVSLGDRVLVSDASGRSLSFVVDSEQLYAADAAPLSQIFATSGPAALVLITCDGAWDQGKHSYDKRLVVYASLAR